jgi:hypothetical protein
METDQVKDNNDVSNFSKNEPHPNKIESTQQKSSLDFFRDKIFLAIFVAVLSFMGGAAGTILTSKFEMEKMQVETAISIKRELFAKRIDLLERTIKVINRLQVVGFYKFTGIFSLENCNKLIKSGNAETSVLAILIEGVVKLKETEAELSTIMALDAQYFGPKTKKAIDELKKSMRSSQDWWVINKKISQDLIDSISEELMSDINLIKKQTAIQ